MTTFRKKIRSSISDKSLQTALDKNAELRVQGLAKAFESLPDGQERRQRAHAVRAEVIDNLYEYLDKFVAKVTENGISVHRAHDATEAINIFLEVIATDSSKGDTISSQSSILIAKSKSMVTEEIGFNHALEAAGHRVVETDLGEFIIQLRGERPSHIITPAVHLGRAQVGQLFQEKLGIPYTEDVPTLTLAARKTLRDIFLTADVGVSGVNFGVAETGTLNLVTNEGNGRMVTSLPPVHVAFMGIERLVRNLDDLALMLSLLSRSATAQKISVYTQLIHTPDAFAGLPGRGLQQKHLILVDNGRSRLLNTPLQESLYCIRCGACLNACPIFREIGGHGYLGKDGNIAPYPGPIGSIVSPGLLGNNYAQLAQASTLCGACKDACPVNIDLPKLLIRVRARPERGGNKDQGNALPALMKFGLRMYTRIATSSSLFAFSQRLAGLGASFVSSGGWLRLPSFTGWGYSKDLPSPATKPFRDRWATLETVEKRVQVAHPNQPKSAPREKPSSAPIDLVERFTAELITINGVVVKCTQSQVAGEITTLLRKLNIDRVQMWKHIPGLDKGGPITEAGLQVQYDADPSIKAGITGALAGIAETGSLVIPGGEGRPLTASLLPDIHIAVLRASDILLSLEDALQLSEVASAPAVVVVSGPSRTTDIEMSLTIGVHGPRELHVFVIIK